MSVMPAIDEQLSNAKLALENFKRFAESNGQLLEADSLFDAIIDSLDLVKATLYEFSPKENYRNVLLGHVAGFISFTVERIPEIEVALRARRQDSIAALFGFAQLRNQLENLLFDLEFFKKLSFFNMNLVAVGANGSGKTTLATKLKGSMGNNGVVISAQRILLIPEIDQLPNPQKTAKELKQIQVIEKSNKSAQELSNLTGEFGKVLKALIADGVRNNAEYKRKAEVLANSGREIPPPPKSRLDLALELWNSLLIHRRLDCEDSMTIVVKAEETPYSAMRMSDGEKVALFLIAQVLQCPENGFVIIDEPEMYLHKSILKKLWDKLEAYRSDCIFIYLTHDLDFATSRVDAKKLWIKSFNQPGGWEIEPLPENDEIPEALMMEVIGSRKTVLFCEGLKGSLDEKIYALLFPNLTVKPVGTCSEVISLTKAFNSLAITYSRAIGLIDMDHSPRERVEKLRENNIYCLGVAEVENLLMEESFLNLVSERLVGDANSVNKIKEDVLQKVKLEAASIASKYVCAKIDFYFKETNLSQGKDMSSLKANFEDFTRIDLDAIYHANNDNLAKLVDGGDYLSAIKIYNNKGLKKIVERNLGISNFSKKAVRILAQDEAARSAVKALFPSELLEADVHANKMS